MEPDPGSRDYWSEEHQLWLPRGYSEPTDSRKSSPWPPQSSRLHLPVPHLTALAITAVLVLLMLVFLDDVPKPLPELIALVSILFFDLTARTIARRKLEWPT